MNLTDEQIQQIETLSGLNYSIAEIAMCLGVDEIEFLYESELPGSKLKYHINRGKLLIRGQVDIELVNSAKNGNITAIQTLEKKKRREELDRIFNKIDEELC